MEASLEFPIHFLKIYSSHRLQQNTQELVVEVIFQCTKCERVFIGTYNSNRVLGYHTLAGVSPKTAQEAKFGEEISNVSPTFVEIYNQALAAEAANLTHIAGMGLGKSLEFLVKDFLISENQDGKDNIEKMLLGTCIKQYINDNNLKVCAERAAWLRNDESHYIRKWEDKDVNDLKLLIRLTINWAENILLTKKYSQEMPQP